MTQHEPKGSMTTIHEAVHEIDTVARELVRHLEPGATQDAMLALRIVDRVSDMKRALGVPVAAEATQEQAV